MGSICFFSSYSESPFIAYYIKYYLEELSRHFETVVFITNTRQIIQDDVVYLKNKQIPLMLVENEGYDFGMWYKGLMAYPSENYDRIGLVNDSAILFKPLDTTFEWIDQTNFDFCGLVDSVDIQYHIQSYFLIINKKAITPVLDYFKKTGFVDGYNQVILAYEIGLSTYLSAMGLKIGAMYNRRHATAGANPSFFLLPQLIKDGMPLIKKKIIFNTYTLRDLLKWIRHDFKINPAYYIKLIKSVNKNTPLLNIEYAILEAGFKKSTAYIYTHIAAFLIYKKGRNILSFFYKTFIKKKVNHSITENN
jgi:lipopolysaccharide biosynthesis protein